MNIATATAPRAATVTAPVAARAASLELATFAPSGAAAALDVYNGAVEVGRALFGGTNAVIRSLTTLANNYGLGQTVSVTGGFLTKTVHYSWQGPNQAIVGAYNDLQRWLGQVNGGY